MIARIALLHTAASNAALFDAALEGLPVRAAELSHHVRPDLLRAPDEATLNEGAAMLEALARGADAVILTCSAIGAAAGRARAAAPVLRADAALAEAATRSGQPVTALYANPDSEGPTSEVFAAAAARSGAALALRRIPGAWALFLAGDLPGYHAAIRAAAAEATGRVALAQASMAAAAPGMQPPPLTVPGTALLAALRAIREAR